MDKLIDGPGVPPAVHIGFAEAQGALGENTTVQPVIMDGHVPIAIPADALFSDPQGQSYVWTVSAALTVSRQKVTPGDMTGGSVFVTSGLRGGERIVTAGVHQLQEGWTITLLESAN